MAKKKPGPIKRVERAICALRARIRAASVLYDTPVGIMLREQGYDEMHALLDYEGFPRSRTVLGRIRAAWSKGRQFALETILEATRACLRTLDALGITRERTDPTIFRVRQYKPTRPKPSWLKANAKDNKRRLLLAA